MESFFKRVPFLILAFYLVYSCSTENKIGMKQHPISEMTDTNVIIPPAWAFGVLYGGYTNQEGTIETIREIQKHDYPIDAYWIDSWFWSFDDKGIGPHKYIDFVADTVAFPDRKKMWDFMEENNIKGGFWVWDCIQETGNEEVFADFKEKGYFRDIYMNTNTWHNKSTSTAMHIKGGDIDGTPTGNIDFDNPEAASYFKTRMKHFFDEGADFIKLDRTTRLSVVKSIFEMSQEFGKETKGRGFMLSHMDGIDNEEYKRYPAKWTSDTRSDWSIENPLKEFNSWVPAIAFKENITLFTDTAKKTSQIPFLTNDTGGFDMGNTDELDEELYIRWVQFSMFNPITSIFSQPENPTGNLAWRYSHRADSIFCFYSHLRVKLFPYIYSYAHDHRNLGNHMLRKIPGQLYDFKLGDEILVSPVYEKNATTRKVLFPEGEWYDYQSGRFYEGGKDYLVAAPIEHIPLFIRKGSIIPMRSYSSSIERGNNDLLHIHIFTGGNTSFRLIEDDGTSNDYLEGIYALTNMELTESEKKITFSVYPVEGFFKGMNHSRNWEFVFHHTEKPEKVLLNKKEKHFSYDEMNGQLTIEIEGYPKSKKILIEILGST
jgi:alpha-glucosidase (family GH31 glycosyl hydrolase)